MARYPQIVAVGLHAARPDHLGEFKLLVHAAGQIDHIAVDHGANAAHALNVTGTFQFTQCIAHNGTAYVQPVGQLQFGRQMVGILPNAVAQLLQQLGHNLVRNQYAAQAGGAVGMFGCHNRVPTFLCVPVQAAKVVLLL